MPTPPLLESYIVAIAKDVMHEMTSKSLFETYYHEGALIEAEEIPANNEPSPDDDGVKRFAGASYVQMQHPASGAGGGFDIEKFKSLKTFKDRVSYAKKYLSKLGQGSSRIALAVDPNTVIKIARNNKGVAQNQVEISVGNVGYEATAQIKDFDRDGLWLEMERATKFSMPKFKKATGYSFVEFNTALNYWYRMNMKPSRFYAPQKAVNQDLIENSELFTNITTLVADFDMPIGDIMRPSSWGIVNRDGKEVPVLIDFGLTSEVFKQHYMR